MKKHFVRLIKKIPLVSYLYDWYCYLLHFRFRNARWNEKAEILADSGIVLMLAPDYSNIGDAAIYVRTLNFFKAYSLPLKCVLVSKQCANIRAVKKIVSSEDVIILQGGGNLGSLYRTEELLRQNIIKSFSGNPIISLPQSIFFEAKQKYFLKKSVSSYRSHNNLVVCARDAASFEFCQSVLGVKSVLLPDMVLSAPLMPGELLKKNKRVLFCIRHDFEKNVNGTDIEQFRQYLSDNGYAAECFDTDDYSGKNISDKESVIEKTLSYFKEFEFVVTDRFHGTVFSYITKTPCIAFDNSYGKVSGAFYWYKKSNYMFFADGYDSAVTSVDKIENISHLDPGEDFKPYFDLLAESISELLEKTSESSYEQNKKILKRRFR